MLEPMASTEPAPGESAPPISFVGHLWRYALILSFSILAWLEISVWQWENNPPWFFLDLFAGAATFVIVWWRRKFPVTVAVITIVVSVVATLAAGPSILALASLATRRRWGEMIPVGILSFAAGLVAVSIDPLTDMPTFYFSIPVSAIGTIAIVAWGMYIGSRRDLMWSFRQRVENAEAQQAARINTARTTERARIAREMHDVLAHRISMIALHAGALSYRENLSPQEIKRSAEVIQTTSHQALEELREILGVLRSDDLLSEADRPQPTADDIPALLSGATRAGMRIDWEIQAALAEIPTNIGRTAYRIVQEALTNASKHAPQARVRVNIFGNQADGLTITAHNRLSVQRTDVPPGAGLGMIGLTERVELVDGKLKTRHTNDDFTLTAWLPWQP